MTNAKDEPNGGGGGGGFYRVQAERDLESNWELDLGQKLEDYLLKICSGELPAEADDHVPINFAEAALLLQGSVQVYSRKVEYLYSLVVRSLEFLSQKGQHEQSEGTSAWPDEGESSHAVSDEGNDMFWGLEDISVEANNCLDSPLGRDAPLNSYVKPPANLVVLEGDCLDTTGDIGELESYLLATNDLYLDFILLDPCDAVAVHNYFSADGVVKGQNSAFRVTSTRKSHQTPTRCSGGTVHRSLPKCQDPNANRSPGVDCSSEADHCKVGPDHPAFNDFDDGTRGNDMDDRYSEPRDLDESDDDDDPWKPLNPHEPGNLKIKPFRKVKASKRKVVNSTKQVSITMLFPPAKLHGTISPELTEMWEMRCHIDERQKGSQSPPLFEKLRESLINGRRETFDAFCIHMDANEDTEYDNEIPDFGHPDADILENMFMDEDVPSSYNDKNDDGGPHFGIDEAFGYDESNPHASLEDLCRSHLDTLLASIAETEKQTELAARVSTWKQKIEHNLEEQESHPAFDIHDYGERIVDRLSFERDNGNVLSFTDVVEGQEKYDVARSFSALLQLVNNGNVELDRSGVDGESVCYTAVNPFHVRLLRHDKRREETGFRMSRKRVRSPLRKACGKVDNNNTGTEKSPSVKSSSKVHKSKETSSPANGNFPVKLGKMGGIRCSPEAKRRRKSRLVEPIDLHSSG